MNEKEKTHYRKAFKSPYLSSADIVDSMVFTISHVKLEIDKTKKTKDLFNTAYFKEKFIRDGEVLKPMILNAGNSRIIKDMTKSSFIDDWNEIPIEIYVDSNVRFGRNTVEGLRISPEPPKLQKPELTPVHKKWNMAIEAYMRDGNFDKIEERMSVSKEHKDMIIEACKGDE